MVNLDEPGTHTTDSKNSKLNKTRSQRTFQDCMIFNGCWGLHAQYSHAALSIREVSIHTSEKPVSSGPRFSTRPNLPTTSAPQAGRPRRGALARSQTAQHSKACVKELETEASQQNSIDTTRVATFITSVAQVQQTEPEPAQGPAIQKHRPTTRNFEEPYSRRWDTPTRKDSAAQEPDLAKTC